MTLHGNSTDFIPLTIIPLTDFPFFNATVSPKPDAVRWNQIGQRRNQMNADAGWDM